jgi:hypothetical protein
MDVSYERVPFRFISCPDCRHQICWINPRLPNHCPECGVYIAGRVREQVMMADDEAILMTHNVQLAGGNYVEGFKNASE